MMSHEKIGRVGKDSDPDRRSEKLHHLTLECVAASGSAILWYFAKQAHAMAYSGDVEQCSKSFLFDGGRRRALAAKFGLKLFLFHFSAGAEQFEQ